jgi:hypothetical protein
MIKIIKPKEGGECPTCRFLLVKDKVKKILKDMEGETLDNIAHKLVEKLELVADIRFYDKKNEADPYSKKSPTQNG